MGILESIMRKREQTATHRTIDGGHPAPYPDMTDEQLYNYEMAFNVPKKTFDRPPSRMKQNVRQVWRDPREPYLEEPFEITSQERAMLSADTEPKQRASASEAAHPRAEQAVGTTTAPAAPQATATAAQAVETPEGLQAELEEPPLFDVSMLDPIPPVAPEPVLPPLDFTRPLRTITTRHPVEIITTRARHPVYKVHAYIGNDEVATVFTMDGRLSENGPRFLENIPQRETLFLNVYATTADEEGERFVFTHHPSREKADADAQPGRLACVPIEFDR